MLPWFIEGDQKTKYVCIRLPLIKSNFDTVKYKVVHE